MQKTWKMHLYRRCLKRLMLARAVSQKFLKVFTQNGRREIIRKEDPLDVVCVKTREVPLAESSYLLLILQTTKMSFGESHVSI